MLADGPSESPGDLCISSSFPQWWNSSTSPSFHASCSASVFQSTDVSHSASLHCSCLTSLHSLLTTQTPLALSGAEMQQHFFSLGSAWKHGRNEQGLNCYHSHFAGLAASHPTENPVASTPLHCWERNCRLNQSAAAILLSQHKYLYRTPKLPWISLLSTPVILFIPLSLWHLLEGMNVSAYRFLILKWALIPSGPSTLQQKTSTEKAGPVWQIRFNHVILMQPVHIYLNIVFKN